MFFGSLFTSNVVQKKILDFRRIGGWGRFLLQTPLGILYSLALDLKVLVAHSFDDLGNIWVSRPHRKLNDWELGEMCRLLSLSDGMMLDLNLREG